MQVAFLTGVAGGRGGEGVGEGRQGGHGRRTGPPARAEAVWEAVGGNSNSQDAEQRALSLTEWSKDHAYPHYLGYRLNMQISGPTPDLQG